MFFQFQVFLYSIFFWLILEILASDWVGDNLTDLTNSGFWFECLLFIFMAVYFFHVAKKISRRLSMTPMPLVFIASTMGLLYFVESIKQETLLIALATVAYYFIHLSLYRLRTYQKDQTAHGIIAAGCLATIFLFYATSYGIYLNFAIPLWFLMSLLMLVTTLVSYQYLRLINEDKKNVLNYSLVLGFIMSEIVWVLNFWPFGYLTTGVIALIFYYVLWDIVQCYFLSELSKKRIVANMVIFGILTAVVLSSTRWLPVV